MRLTLCALVASLAIGCGGGTQPSSKVPTQAQVTPRTLMPSRYEKLLFLEEGLDARQYLQSLALTADQLSPLQTVLMSERRQKLFEEGTVREGGQAYNKSYSALISGRDLMEHFGISDELDFLKLTYLSAPERNESALVFDGRIRGYTGGARVAQMIADRVSYVLGKPDISSKITWKGVILDGVGIVREAEISDKESEFRYTIDVQLQRNVKKPVFDLGTPVATLQTYHRFVKEVDGRSAYECLTKQLKQSMEFRALPEWNRWETARKESYRRDWDKLNVLYVLQENDGSRAKVEATFVENNLIQYKQTFDLEKVTDKWLISNRYKNK